MATQPRPDRGPGHVEPATTMPEMTAGPAVGSHTQWGAITAGTFAGFAAFLLLTVLGLAVGITVGEPAAFTQQLGVGAGIWWFMTLLATGLVGGWVLGLSSRSDRPYMPIAFGTVTWVLGTLILLVLLAMGVGNILGGVGGAVGQVIAAGPEGLGMAEDVQVAGLATPTVWILFGSMLIGWLATVGGAMLAAPARRSTGYSLRTEA